MKFIDLDTQYNLIKKDLNKRLNRIFKKKDFILGKEVTELEKNLSKISKFSENSRIFWWKMQNYSGFK